VRREVLEIPLADHAKMRWLQSDGEYLRPVTREEGALNSQEYLLSLVQTA
jgi:hypothetical protein